MARGRKNYFRHSFFAHSDDFILDLISKFGYQGYYIWFTLLEICGEEAAEEYPEIFRIHAQRLRASLRITTRKLDDALTFMSLRSRLSYTKVENTYHLKIANFPKYIGRYESKCTENSTKERKGKKRKEKERKEIKQQSAGSGLNDQPPMSEKERKNILSDTIKFLEG